jgi:hypothetical protein
MRIATGQIEDTTTEDGKNAAAVALGRMGAWIIAFALLSPGYSANPA